MRVRHNMIQEKLKETIIEYMIIGEDEIPLDSRVDAGINFGLERFGMDQFSLL
jgi:hypothetical protein